MTHANNLVQPTVQHNTPIFKGGEHELGNISVICRSCNSSIRDKETGELNSREVAEVWDKICELEGHGIDWFHNTSLLCQAIDSQVTDTCQPNDSTDKIRLDKNRLDKSRINSSVSADTPIAPPAKPKKKSNKEVLSLVEGRSDAFKEAWQGFVDMRKANKKPMTERAAQMILKKLDKLSGGDEETQIAILDKSVVKCWSDVYELKEQSSKQSNQPSQQPKDVIDSEIDWSQFDG
jgi:hypothetical protein